jgi:signal peptidase II
MNFLCSKAARILLAAVMLTACIGCDQATKRIATATLRHEGPRSYLANTLRLEYSLNPGAFLSLGGNLPPGLRFWLFTVSNAALLVAVAWYLLARWDMRLTMFVALVSFLAGGIGNLMDRMLHDGLVTDFLILGVGPLSTGIFNVADEAITTGALAAACLHYRETPVQQPPQGCAAR